MQTNKNKTWVAKTIYQKGQSIGKVAIEYV